MNLSVLTVIFSMTFSFAYAKELQPVKSVPPGVFECKISSDMLKIENENNGLDYYISNYESYYKNSNSEEPKWESPSSASSKFSINKQLTEENLKSMIGTRFSNPHNRYFYENEKKVYSSSYQTILSIDDVHENVILAFPSEKNPQDELQKGNYLRLHLFRVKGDLTIHAVLKHLNKIVINKNIPVLKDSEDQLYAHLNIDLGFKLVMEDYKKDLEGLKYAKHLLGHVSQFHLTCRFSAH